MALILDGTQYARAPLPATRNSANPWTLFSYVYFSNLATGANQSFFTVAHGSDAFKMIGQRVLDATDTIVGRFRPWTSEIVAEDTGLTLVTGTWYPCLMQWDEVNKEAGIQIADRAMVKATGAHADADMTDINIGCGYAGGGFTSPQDFHFGREAHNAQWNTLLPQEDIDNLMQGIKKPNQISIAPDHYKPFINDQTGGTGTDYTLFGAPTIDSEDPAPVSIAIETDSVFALVEPIGLTTETDSVFALFGDTSISLTNETDSVISLAEDIPLNVVSETDSTFLLVNDAPINITSETDSVISLANDIPINLTSETDSAFILVNDEPINAVNETESVFVLVNDAPIGITSETDSAFSLVNEAFLAIAEETDSVISLANDIPLNVVNETETVFTLPNSIPIGLASETDSVISLAEDIPVNLTSETDFVFTLVNNGPINLSNETDSVFSLADNIPINLTNETETVFALSAIIPLGLASESDFVFGIVNDAPISLTNETDFVFSIVNDAPPAIGFALSNEFYEELKLEVDEILLELGTTYTIRALGQYNPDELQTVPGATRIISGLVADQQTTLALTGMAEGASAWGNWVATKTLILSAGANPAPGEDVQVDGKWFSMSKVVPIKPAEIVVLYLLDVTR